MCWPEPRAHVQVAYLGRTPSESQGLVTRLYLGALPQGMTFTEVVGGEQTGGLPKRG